jgi:triosephosphate isomerase
MERLQERSRASFCFSLSPIVWTDKYNPTSSPLQLKDADISYVILGHSERRTLFHETSSFVAQKTQAALSASLTVILCVGETLSQRESGKTDEVVQEQLKVVVETIKEADWAYVFFPTFSL